MESTPVVLLDLLQLLVAELSRLHSILMCGGGGRGVWLDQANGFRRLGHQLVQPVRVVQMKRYPGFNHVGGFGDAAHNLIIHGQPDIIVVIQM